MEIKFNIEDQQIFFCNLENLMQLNSENLKKRILIMPIVLNLKINKFLELNSKNDFFSLFEIKIKISKTSGKFSFKDIFFVKNCIIHQFDNLPSYYYIKNKYIINIMKNYIK